MLGEYTTPILINKAEILYKEKKLLQFREQNIVEYSLHLAERSTTWRTLSNIRIQYYRTVT